MRHGSGTGRAIRVLAALALAGGVVVSTAGAAQAGSVHAGSVPAGSVPAAAVHRATPTAASGSAVIDCYTTDDVLRPALTQSGVGYGAILVDATFTGLQPGTAYHLVANLHAWAPVSSYPPVPADGTGSVVFARARIGVNQKFTWVSGSTYPIYVTDDDYTLYPDVLASFTTTLAVNRDCGSLIVGSPQDRVLSSDGAYSLVQQSDGNLVLYRGGVAHWNARTAGHPGARTVMQGDGNLVVYSSTGRALWNSHTGGHAGASLVVQTDGSLVIHYQGRTIWASSTG